MSDIAQGILNVWDFIISLSIFGFSVWAMLFRLIGITISVVFIGVILYLLYYGTYRFVKIFNSDFAEEMNETVTDAIYFAFFDSSISKSIQTVCEAIGKSLSNILILIAKLIEIVFSGVAKAITYPVVYLNDLLNGVTEIDYKQRLEMQKTALNEAVEFAKREQEAAEIRKEIREIKKKTREARKWRKQEVKAITHIKMTDD